MVTIMVMMVIVVMMAMMMVTIMVMMMVIAIMMIMVMMVMIAKMTVMMMAIVMMTVMAMIVHSLLLVTAPCYPRYGRGGATVRGVDRVRGGEHVSRGLRPASWERRQRHWYRE